MAVYRCEVKTVKRSSGRSAVAAAAYRSADRLHDERADKSHDYRRRSRGVAHAEIITPPDAPSWARQRDRLWNEAEKAENRRNSVTAREILLSLPHELDDQKRIELTRGFASRLVERYGVAVDIAIHRPDRRGDERNHHAHVMMTTRRLSADGFTEKTRELDDVVKRGPAEIEAIRLQWENEQNQMLERSGRQERVSRLSNQARGLDREPEPKIGPAANAMLRRGEETRIGEQVQEVRKRNSMRENMARQRFQKLSENADKAASTSFEVRPTDIANRQMGRFEQANDNQQDKLAEIREMKKQRQLELMRMQKERARQNQNSKDLGRLIEPPEDGPS